MRFLNNQRKIVAFLRRAEGRQTVNQPRGMKIRPRGRSLKCDGCRCKVLRTFRKRVRKKLADGVVPVSGHPGAGAAAERTRAAVHQRGGGDGGRGRHCPTWRDQAAPPPCYEGSLRLAAGLDQPPPPLLSGGRGWIGEVGETVWDSPTGGLRHHPSFCHFDQPRRLPPPGTLSASNACYGAPPPPPSVAFLLKIWSSKRREGGIEGRHDADLE